MPSMFCAASVGFTCPASAAALISSQVMFLSSPCLSLGSPHPQLAHISASSSRHGSGLSHYPARYGANRCGGKTARLALPAATERFHCGGALSGSPSAWAASSALAVCSEVAPSAGHSPASSATSGESSYGPCSLGC